MRPVFGSSQLVERDVAQNRVAQDVVRDGDVAREIVVRRGSAGRQLPVCAGIFGIGHFRRRLKRRRDLLRIFRVDRDRRLVEESGMRADRDYLRARRRRQWLLRTGHFATAASARKEATVATINNRRVPFRLFGSDFR